MNRKDEIRKLLYEPYLILKNALDDDIACALRDELKSTTLWQLHSHEGNQGNGVPELADDYTYRRMGILMNNEHTPPLLHQLNEYLNSEKIRAWFSYVSERRCDYFHGSAASFGPGDHIAQHDDNLTISKGDGTRHQRVVTMNYWLTENWQKEWGGELVWERPYEEFVPTFNTLVIFLPGPSTVHWVNAVTDTAPERRLSITGWWHTIRKDSEKPLNLNLV